MNWQTTRSTTAPHRQGWARCTAPAVWLLGWAFYCGLVFPTPGLAAPPEVIVVVGAAGEEKYGQLFTEWAQQWSAAAVAAGTECTIVGLEPDDELSDYERLKQLLIAANVSDERPIWLVMLGHGTYDGRKTRFNLRRKDVSAEELGRWLQHLERPLALLNCSAASAPFLPPLSGSNRVVITATQSGDELQFAHFGGAIAKSVNNPEADLDKDRQTSLLEAVVYAGRQVRQFYNEQGRLVTEHALIDDNGDQRGTPLAWFEGTMAVTQTKSDHQLDGGLAHQWHLQIGATEEKLGPRGIEKRAELEQQLASLRRRKAEFQSEQLYYQQLEMVLVQLARLYHH